MNFFCVQNFRRVEFNRAELKIESWKRKIIAPSLRTAHTSLTLLTESKIFIE